MQLSRPTPISPRLHGVLDYMTSATVAAVPRFMDFPMPARRAAEALAGGFTGMAAVTDYPLSARRMVPFKAHGVTDIVVGLAIPALPWLLGFSEDRAARNFFLGLGALTMIVTALTNWSGEGADLRRRGPKVRRRRKPRRA